MGHIEFLPHTADEKFTITAPDLEDAFSTSVQACAQIMVGKKNLLATETKHVSIEALHLRSLLYDFLNEIIASLDESHVLYFKATAVTISGEEGNYSLQATLHGIHADNVPFRTVIKNMTYSDMVIEEGEHGVLLTVVVDI